MSYLEVFGVLTGVGVDVSKFFRVGAVVLTHGAGAEPESEKCDSAHLCNKLTNTNVSNFNFSSFSLPCYLLLLY